MVLLGSLVFAVSTGHAAPSGGCVVAATTTCTFIYQTPNGAPEAWMVPAGVTSAVFDVFGAQGGNSPAADQPLLPGGSAGKGGHVQATVALTPGATLNMRVGGAGQDAVFFTFDTTNTATSSGGFNGGGSNMVTCGGCRGFLGGSGGGSSDVRTSGDTLLDRLLVAGGGGGAGGGAGSDRGDGGNSATTAKSVTALFTCSGGGAGTLLAPGAAGSGFVCSGGSSGAAGGLTGGAGNTAFIGAGGGGLFGGGAGAAFSNGASGGGGGSDYPDPLNPPAGTSNVTVTDGVRTGNGLITVTYTTPSAVTFASAGATRTSKGVLVRWRTGTEADLLGFQVYRSRGNAWQRITHSLIAAKGSVSGGSHRFLDKGARHGVSYRYRIKAVNRDGTASWFGPVRVT